MDEKKKKILIVEDDLQLQEALTVKLAYEGFETDIAHDGEEGLIKVRDFRPDLVLLDIVMPKMDGLEMFRRMRDTPDFRLLPVILLTNLSSQESIASALEHGVTTYLVKTDWTLEEIVKRIRVTLDCEVG
jgi:DNA-binding response OmpR family regulator